MKKVLLISLILIMFINLTVFSEELNQDKTTMYNLIYENEPNLIVVNVYDFRQNLVSWQFSGSYLNDILDIAKNTVLIPISNQGNIKKEESYISIIYDIYVSYDGYVAISSDNTNNQLEISYKIENLNYFKNNIDKILSAQSHSYLIHAPSKYQLTEVSEWARDYHEFALENDLLPEYLKIGFLTNKITREQFCDILFKLLEKTAQLEWSEDNKNPFEDTVNKNVIILYNKDIIKGKSEINFSPNTFITREEAATLLDRAAEYIKIKRIEKVDGIYADDSKISDWAKDAVYNMLSLGIMEGTGENFSPYGTYTREQAIATIVRLYNTFAAEKLKSE